MVHDDICFIFGHLLRILDYIDIKGLHFLHGSVIHGVLLPLHLSISRFPSALLLRPRR